MIQLKFENKGGAWIMLWWRQARITSRLSMRGARSSCNARIYCAGTQRGKARTLAHTRTRTLRRYLSWFHETLPQVKSGYREYSPGPRRTSPDADLVCGQSLDFFFFFPTFCLLPEPDGLPRWESMRFFPPISSEALLARNSCVMDNNDHVL